MIRLSVDPTFVPHPGGQAAAWSDRRNSHLFLEGGMGSGKTWIAARMILDAHIHNAFAADGSPTGVPSAIVGPSQTSISDIQIPAIDEAARAMGLRADYRYEVRLDGRPLKGVIILPDLQCGGVSSYLLVRTAAAPARITGWEVGAAWGDEATRWPEDRVNPKRDPYIQILGRVRHPRARFLRSIFSYTNEGDATRVYEEARSGAPGTALYRLRTADNPAVAEWMEQQRGRLSPELQEQYLEGGAISMRGAAVYYSFQDAPPVVDPAAALAPGPIAVSIDFNISPGMHAVIGQHRPAEDRIDIVDEIHRPGLTGQQLIADLATRWRAMRVRPPVEIFGDPAGSQRNASTGRSHWQEIMLAAEAAAMPVRLRVKVAHEPIIDGINAVNGAMRGVDGGCRLRVHPRCSRTREDLRRLTRDRFGEIDDSDPTVGHLADALRYFVEYVRPVQIPRIERRGRISVGVGPRMVG